MFLASRLQLMLLGGAVLRDCLRGVVFVELNDAQFIFQTNLTTEALPLCPSMGNRVRESAILPVRLLLK